MISRPGEPTTGPRHDLEADIAAEDAGVAELYEHAPCGHVSTLPDGTIVKINDTLLSWLGLGPASEVVGRRRFSDLLTMGGRIHHETHVAPLLAMQGSIGGFALDMLTADGTRLPVLLASTLTRDPDGRPARIRTVVLDARDRRSYERELLRARQDADHERDRVQRLATVLQRTLLPPQLPDVPGIDTAAYYHPASLDDVGGDFYDLFPLADGRWGFFVGDVCGKGAAAAALTSLTRYTLRSTAVTDPDPVAVLTHLDAVLAQERHHHGSTFCTVIFGVLTVRPGHCEVTLAGGGHPPALLLRAGGDARFVELAGGQLLGAVPDARFARDVVDLGPGDTLLLYTDGLVEARIDDDRTRYDEDDLLVFGEGLAPASAAEAVGATIRLVEGFGEGIDDDVALLAIGVPRR